MTKLAAAFLMPGLILGTAIPGDAQTPALEGLDGFITDQMEEWKVPGLAIAIVQDGKVIHTRGYGYRDVERELPVTTKTRFGIGSTPSRSVR